MARPRRKGRDADDMPVFEVDGLPYIDAAWLERRIYRDFSRMQRWNQEAHRFSQRSDAAGRETCKAYLTQALHMSYRVEKWRRCLAITQAAIVGLQATTRASFAHCSSGVMRLPSTVLAKPHCGDSARSASGT